MIRPRHFPLLLTSLAVLTASCGKQREKQETVAPDEKSARSKERVADSRGDDGPEAKVALRENYETALALGDPEAREKALEQIAWDGIDVDPHLAREAFESLKPDSAATRKLVAHFAGRLSDTDPEQAIEWARTLEQEQERAEAFGRIAVVIAAKDPVRGAALATEELPAGKIRDRAVVQVVQRWSQASPAAAADWLAGTPAGAARSAGMKIIVDHWLETDTPALAGWVESREAKDLRMESLLAVAKALRVEKPELRAEKLAAFRDDEIRRQIENLLAQSPP